MMFKKWKREFVINCRGVGVHPPLRLSSQRVNFRATCLNSTSFETIYVLNEHVDYDQHLHPVPRIGSGEIAKVGATSFEFDVPDNCPFKLSPAVGTVAPGQRIKITLQYTASLSDAAIRKEAVKIIKAKMYDKKHSKLTSSEINMSTANIEVKIDTLIYICPLNWHF